MELKKLNVIGACVAAFAILYGTMTLLVWFRVTYARPVPDPEQTVAYWKDRVEVFKEETRAAEERALFAEIDELKARLAVASAEKARENLEDALRRERGTK